jgi:hypothetical protein
MEHASETSQMQIRESSGVDRAHHFIVGEVGSGHEAKCTYVRVRGIACFREVLHKGSRCCPEER